MSVAISKSVLSAFRQRGWNDGSYRGEASEGALVAAENVGPDAVREYKVGLRRGIEARNRARGAARA